MLEACVSGVMEALELFHAETFSEWMPFSELPHWLNVPELSGFPRAIGPDGKFRSGSSPRMTLGIDIVSGSRAAVPYDLVHADFGTDALRNGDGFVVSSNGLGGGNCYHEAVRHGLCEVIEGDAVALFQASGPHKFSRVAWRTVEDPIVRHLHETCRGCNMNAIAWDITTEIGVPTFYCRIIEQRRGPSRLSSATDGAGCHLDPAVALKRALMEAMQTRLLLISGARDDIRPRYYSAKTPASEGSGEEVPLRAGSGYDNRSARDMVKGILDRLASAGHSQAIAVDLKSRSPALAFVRVVIPGLEAFPHSRGYSPGRRAREARQRS